MRYRLALCGFSEFEYRTMRFSFEHPPESTGPGYEIVDAVIDADFAVVDADSKPAVKGIVLAGYANRAVFIGSSAPAGAAAHIARPIDTNRILRALYELVPRGQAAGRRPPPAPVPDPARTPVEPATPRSPGPPAAALAAARTRRAGLPEPPVVSDAFEPPIVHDVLEPAQLPRSRAENPAQMPSRFDLRAAPFERRPRRAYPPAEAPVSRPKPPPGPSGSPAPAASERPAPAAARRADDLNAAKAAARAKARRARFAQSSADGAAPLRDVLVLGDDGAASARLCGLLDRFGFAPVALTTLRQAAQLLHNRPPVWAAVFLDVPLDDAGVALLRELRALPRPEAQPPLALWLVADRVEPAHRVRIALAGLPEPLLKPLERGDVARALERSGVPFPADARRH